MHIYTNCTCGHIYKNLILRLTEVLTLVLNELLYMSVDIT